MEIFSVENGFVEANGLGYDAKTLLRQNARHAKYMAPFKKSFEGKRVLDLGASDGRWSFASVANGATSVVAIEYRPENIALSAHLLKPELAKQVNFIQGDMFEIMPQLLAKKQEFDIILCLGLVQHVADHSRLLALMTSFRPELIIVDGRFIDSDENFSLLKAEPAKGRQCAAPASPTQAMAPVGIISRGGFKFLARLYGYKVKLLPWKKNQAPGVMSNYFRPNEEGIKAFSMTLMPAKPAKPAASTVAAAR